MQPEEGLACVVDLGNNILDLASQRFRGLLMLSASEPEQSRP